MYAKILKTETPGNEMSWYRQNTAIATAAVLYACVVDGLYAALSLLLILSVPEL
jgi:hypothetical protein